MTKNELHQALLKELFSDVAERDNFPQKRPLLAHYTSLPALEGILVTEEVWFSNPLYMNDMEEVRFGILTGANILRSSDAIRTAMVTEDRHRSFLSSFDHFVNYFDQQHLFDTYVFCLSESPFENGIPCRAFS